jgi:hypothetical protein
MRTYLMLTLLILLLISGLLAARIQQPDHPEGQPAEEYIARLKEGDRAVKSLHSPSNNQTFWLSLSGKLHILHADSTVHTTINQGEGAWKDVTFVEDFCLSPSGDSIYFTDIMDLQSGLSTIKRTDIQGNNIEVITYLDKEIPYLIRLMPKEDLLFFLSKKETKGLPSFSLRYIDLSDGSRGTLYTSDSKLYDIHTDLLQNSVSTLDSRQELHSFSTEMPGVSGLADAQE